MLAKHLNSIYDSGWRILVILAVLVQATLMPLDFIFDLSAKVWYRSLDIGISLVYLFDFIGNIYQYKRIQRYSGFKDIYWDAYSSKKYFVSDVLVLLPYALWFSNPLWQLLRMFKWVKVLRTMYYFQIRNIRQSSIISLWFMIIGIFIFSHWFTCVWLKIHGFETNLTNVDNYVRALYWIITTLTSVGYGDIVPNGNSEMLFAILLQLVGVGGLAFLIGNVVGIFTKKNPADKRFIENMEKLRSLIHYHDIPMDLEKRISDYFTYEWKQKLGYDENELLESLPFGLSNELHLEFRKNAIKNIPIFAGANESFLREIAHHLKLLILTPGDYLFRSGDEAISMFFVQKGKLEVLSRDEKRQITVLKEGDFMGEIALFKETTRTATVKSSGYSDIYELNKSEFNKVLMKYPKIASQIEAEAKLREKRYM